VAVGGADLLLMAVPMPNRSIDHHPDTNRKWLAGLGLLVFILYIHPGTLIPDVNPFQTLSFERRAVHVDCARPFLTVHCAHQRPSSVRKFFSPSRETGMRRQDHQQIADMDFFKQFPAACGPSCSCDSALT
jgi:hypothetical protein